MADDVRVNEHGDLEFERATEEGKASNKINMAIAAGKWLVVYAASMMDGTPVAVEYWDGEIKRKKP